MASAALLRQKFRLQKESKETESDPYKWTKMIKKNEHRSKIDDLVENQKNC